MHGKNINIQTHSGAQPELLKQPLATKPDVWIFTRVFSEHHLSATKTHNLIRLRALDGVHCTRYLSVCKCARVCVHVCSLFFSSVWRSRLRALFYFYYTFCGSARTCRICLYAPFRAPHVRTVRHIFCSPCGRTQRRRCVRRIRACVCVCVCVRIWLRRPRASRLMRWIVLRIFCAGRAAAQNLYIAEQKARSEFHKTSSMGSVQTARLSQSCKESIYHYISDKLARINMGSLPVVHSLIGNKWIAFQLHRAYPHIIDIGHLWFAWPTLHFSWWLNILLVSVMFLNWFTNISKWMRFCH